MERLDRQSEDLRLWLEDIFVHAIEDEVSRTLSRIWSVAGDRFFVDDIGATLDGTLQDIYYLLQSVAEDEEMDIDSTLEQVEVHLMEEAKKKGTENKENDHDSEVAKKQKPQGIYLLDEVHSQELETEVYIDEEDEEDDEDDEFEDEDSYEDIYTLETDDIDVDDLDLVNGDPFLTTVLTYAHGEDFTPEQLSELVSNHRTTYKHGRLSAYGELVDDVDVADTLTEKAPALGFPYFLSALRSAEVYIRLDMSGMATEHRFPLGEDRELYIEKRYGALELMIRVLKKYIYNECMDDFVLYLYKEGYLELSPQLTLIGEEEAAVAHLTQKLMEKVYYICLNIRSYFAPEEGGATDENMPFYKEHLAPYMQILLRYEQMIHFAYPEQNLSHSVEFSRYSRLPDRVQFFSTFLKDTYKNDEHKNYMLHELITLLHEQGLFDRNGKTYEYYGFTGKEFEMLLRMLKANRAYGTMAELLHLCQSDDVAYIHSIFSSEILQNEYGREKPQHEWRKLMALWKPLYLEPILQEFRYYKKKPIPSLQRLYDVAIGIHKFEGIFGSRMDEFQEERELVYEYLALLIKGCETLEIQWEIVDNIISANHIQWVTHLIMMISELEGSCDRLLKPLKEFYKNLFSQIDQFPEVVQISFYTEVLEYVDLVFSPAELDGLFYMIMANRGYYEPQMVGEFLTSMIFHVTEQIDTFTHVEPLTEKQLREMHSYLVLLSTWMEILEEQHMWKASYSQNILSAFEDMPYFGEMMSQIYSQHSSEDMYAEIHERMYEVLEKEDSTWHHYAGISLDPPMIEMDDDDENTTVIKHHEKRKEEDYLEYYVPPFYEKGVRGEFFPN